MLSSVWPIPCLEEIQTGLVATGDVAGGTLKKNGAALDAAAAPLMTVLAAVSTTIFRHYNGALALESSWTRSM